MHQRERPHGQVPARYGAGCALRVCVLTHGHTHTVRTRGPHALLTHPYTDVEDVQSHMPGAIEALRNWLRDYKSHKGITNTFAMGGECQDRVRRGACVQRAAGSNR